MSIYDQTKKTATVSRINASDDYESAGSIMVSIHSLADNDKAFFDGEISRGFKAYTDLSSDVEKTDRITVEGVVYDVLSTTDYDFGSFPHKKLMLERPHQNASS